MNAEVRAIRTPAEQALNAAYAAARAKLPGKGAIADLREAAFQRFDAAGLPHRRIEEWKYTDLRALMQGDRVELVAQQRSMKVGDFPLAIAENDRVLEIIRGPDQAAQGLALLVRIAAGCDQQLGDRHGCSRRFRHFDAHRIVQEGVCDALNFRGHRRSEKQSLSGERHQLSNALDVGNETHVQDEQRAHPVV